MIFPWQEKQWQQLWQSWRDGRLPHALLLTGLSGLGKKQFAEAFLQAQLCKQVSNSGQACGKCHDCHLLQTKAHPNVLWVEPTQESHAIKIDQIREVSEFVQQTSFQGTQRMVVVCPAENMNLAAANALLKTLEEPAAGLLLMLITQQSDTLPATILSRCQRVVFLPPEKSQALSWLTTHWQEPSLDPELLLGLAQGAPLQALASAQPEQFMLRREVMEAFFKEKHDPLHYAVKWKDEEIALILMWIQSGLVDVLRAQSTGVKEYLQNQDYAEVLLPLSQKISAPAVMAKLDKIQEVRRSLAAGVHLNKQLLLEAVMTT